MVGFPLFPTNSRLISFPVVSDEGGLIVGLDVVGALDGAAVIGALVGLTVVGARVGLTVVGPLEGELVVGDFVGLLVGLKVMGALEGEEVIGALVGLDVVGSLTRGRRLSQSILGPAEEAERILIVCVPLSIVMVFFSTVHTCQERG